MELIFLQFAVLALAFAVFEMLATDRLARRLRNAGIVDIVWSGGFAVLVLLFLGLAANHYYDAKLNGFPEWIWQRAAVFTLLVVIWSLRLAAHLFVRVKSHHPVEDVRYARLRADWGKATDRKMSAFFQLQGVLQIALMTPFLFIYLNERIEAIHFGILWRFGLGPFEWIGIALWLIALAGEALADAQLKSFRADPVNKGKVCQAGLWYYSRHPNYFFEWLIWVAYFLFACGSPWGWVSVLCPVLMGHFLVNVTGIPMTEELSVKSKGDAYRDYQRTTSAFVPWFKKGGNN